MSGNSSRRSIVRQSVGAKFRVLSPTDALDALDHVRPDGFDSGVLVVLLDYERRPLVGIAVDNAPSEELCAIGESVIASVSRAKARTSASRNRMVVAVVFGLVRDTNSETVDDGPARLVLSSAELLAWRECQHLFAAHGIDPLDLLILEPCGWASFRDH